MTYPPVEQTVQQPVQQSGSGVIVQNPSLRLLARTLGFALCVFGLVFAIAGRASAADAAANAADARKPNIIFVLSDDVAQGDLGSYGQELIQTPNLDRMAAEGTRYLQAYCGTSVCAPSRSSLITGLHCGHCPVRGNFEVPPEGQLPLPAETSTIAEILKPAGYKSACMGKWGMGFFDTSGSPLKQGFDHFYGYNCQREAHSYFPSYLYDDDQKILLPGNDSKSIGETYAQDRIQQDVLGWIRENAENPFFLFYAITLPHGRHEIDDLGIYEDKPWTMAQKSYAAQVTRFDHDMGEMVELLQELDIDENTLVIISGDNGSSFNPKSEMGSLFDQASNGLRGYKRGLYEGALRQAAIARWPGTVPAGRVTDEPWAFWDILPTAAELAGVELTEDVATDGYSLVEFLKGGPAPKRDYFYWELHENKPIQAARFDNWKAVRNGINAKTELYDLSKDPGEENNLAAANLDIVERAEAIFAEAHTPDPNWPMTGKPDFRVKSEKAAWEASRERRNAATKASQ